MAQRQSGYQRQPDDEYETPSWVGQVVAPYLGHCRHVWDPANGPASKIAREALRDRIELDAAEDAVRLCLPDEEAP